MSLRTATTSGSLSSSAVVANRPALLLAYTVQPAAADATLTIYDNASAASGTVLGVLFVKASTSSQTVGMNFPVEADKGIYASLSGVGATCIVHYSLL